MTKTIGTSDLIDVWAATGSIAAPDSTKLDAGWQLGERPPHEYMNYLQNVFGATLNHILKNGVPLWNSGTTYATNNLAARNGVVYVALNASLNSQPPSADWRDLVDLSSLGTMSVQNANAVSITGGSAYLSGEFGLSGVISPTALASNQNNYSPTGLATANTLRLSASGADRNITGLAASSAGAIKIIHNIGASNSIVLVSQSSSSSAANRFAFLGSIVLAPDDSVTLRYDGVSQRWRNISPYVRELPVSTVICTCSSAVEAGYLSADGTAVSRSTYSALFSKIGTTFGAGDGSTTFNLPDMRGEFVRGWDNGRGVDSGRALGSFQADEFKSHTHEFYNSSTDGVQVSPKSALFVSGITSSTLATGGAETRPRNLAFHYQVKY